MLTNVGFDDAKQKVVVGSLSGGWKMKLALGEWGGVGEGGGGGVCVGCVVDGRMEDEAGAG